MVSLKFAVQLDEVQVHHKIKMGCTKLTIFPFSPDGPRSAGWREHPDQRRRFPFDAREDERGYRRPRSGSGSLEDERDSLPEWCLEDADEEAGTFDSSGAFLSLKVRRGLSGVLNTLMNYNGLSNKVLRCRLCIYIHLC